MATYEELGQLHATDSDYTGSRGDCTNEKVHFVQLLITTLFTSFLILEVSQSDSPASVLQLQPSWNPNSIDLPVLVIHSEAMRGVQVGEDGNEEFLEENKVGQ